MHQPPTPMWRKAIGLILLPATLASAQSDNPDAPASTEPPGEQIVTLEEFTVSTSSVSEYVAAESITGTRVASRIQDLPFKVNVVTSEFMDDFFALEFGEQFAYTSNVIAYETISTGYSIRGFEADVQLRNGFRRIGLIDKVNVDRAEVIKGPAASIYGTVLPGGVVNIITKKPEAKPSQRIALSAGSNSLLRAQASSTGPVGSSDQLFYRVDLAVDSREYDLPFKKKDQHTGSVQLMWKPGANTSLLVEVERLVRDEVGNANTPFVVEPGVPDPYRNPTNSGPRTYNRYVRLADELIDFNVQGPQNYSKRFVNTVTGTLEHRFSNALSFRSSVNWFDRELERQEVGGRDQYRADRGRLSNSASWVPRLRPFGEGGSGWQNDLLASFETGVVRHKLLVTLDYQRQWEKPERYDATLAALPADVAANGLSVTDPDYSYITYAQDPSLYSTSQKEHNSLDVYGIFISERATFMDGKVIALLGGRYDYVDSHARDLFGGSDSTRKVDDITYQLGLNVRAAPGVSLYANASTSFVPQYGVGRNSDGTTYDLPNEEGKGWEAGIKAGFLENRLTFSAGYFDITRGNVARDTFDTELGALVTVLSGEEASRGFEFDFNWVATQQLQFFGGYGYTDSSVVSHASARHLIGTSTRRTPDTTVGLGAKYDVKGGPLNGLFLTAGYKYNSESLINPSTGRNLNASNSNPILNNRLPNGLLIFPDLAEGAVVTSGSARVDDGREMIFNNPYHVVDAGIGYRWSTRAGAKRYRHRVQLNLSNVLDEIYTFGSAGAAGRRAYVFTYDLRF